MTAFEIGYKAYEDGDLREDNPYPITTEHDQWILGFDSAAADNDICTPDDGEEPEDVYDEMDRLNDYSGLMDEDDPNGNYYDNDSDFEIN